MPSYSILSLNTDSRAISRDYQEPVLSPQQPAFQYSSHLSLQAPSGNMWWVKRVTKWVKWDKAQVLLGRNDERPPDLSCSMPISFPEPTHLPVSTREKRGLREQDCFERSLWAGSRLSHTRESFSWTWRPDSKSNALFGYSRFKERSYHYAC